MANYILTNIEHNEDGFLCYTVGKSVKLYSFLEAKEIVLSELRTRIEEMKDILKIRKEIIRSYDKLIERCDKTLEIPELSVDPNSVSVDTIRLYNEAFCSKCISTETGLTTYINPEPIGILWARIERNISNLNTLSFELKKVTYCNEENFSEIASNLSFKAYGVVTVEEDEEPETIEEV